MINNSLAPVQIILGFYRNRDLICVSAKREILGRYRGSVMGLLWPIFIPIFMLAIYTFVFSVVFKAKWGGTGGSKTEFALMLFAGLIVFNIFSECINRAPGLILANVNYVKKVVFPLEILPVVSICSALFHGAISLAVWFIAYFIIFGVPHMTVFYLPLILFPYVLFILGLSWGLASLGVYLRDVGQVVNLLTTVLMFMSPIFYPVAALPEIYQNLLYLNPLTTVIEQVRCIIYLGIPPNFFIIAVYWVISFATAWLGLVWFQKTRKGFADVL